MTKETSQSRDGRVYTVGTRAGLGKNLIQFQGDTSGLELSEYLVNHKQFTSLSVDCIGGAPDNAGIQDKRVANLDVHITASPTESNTLVKIYM